MDDVAAFLVAALTADPTIATYVEERVLPEGEQATADLPAITYLLTGGFADELLEFPAYKIDVWAAKNNPAHLQRLTDAIDSVLRGRRFTTSADRRVGYCQREGVWFDVPDPDSRHRSSLWRMVTI